MKVITEYFEEKGKDNTDVVLKLVNNRAAALGIKTILVATTQGGTAVQALEQLTDNKIIGVTHVDGFKGPNVQELTDENRKAIESKGGIIVTAGHSFWGVGRAVRGRYQSPGLGDIIADTLRIFGQGMKVCCEITLMAADAGIIPVDQDIIAIGGSGHGADTAVVLTPAYTHTMFDLKVREIICKPRHF